MDCASIALAALMAITNPPSNVAAETASDAICKASQAHGIHPSWMVAYLAVENRDYHIVGTGSDTGLFQVNLHWHRDKLGADIYDYYAQANASAEIISENISEFGLTWNAVAAYNSWNQASKETDIARAYYEKWQSKLKAIIGLWQSDVAMNKGGQNGV